MIPLSVPSIKGNEWNYIKECLDTNWVSSVGSFVDRFERSLASRVGTRHAIATSSGTAALHVALMVAGVKPNDEVCVSDLTFIAPANAVRYIGAWPAFIDAEPRHWQMDPEKLESFIKCDCTHKRSGVFNRHTGRQVKAIVPVHILGHSCDMEAICQVASQYDLVVVEDATESLGATYRGEPVGHLGQIACFSFNGNKIITTGGGGMIVTDDDKWAQRARYLTTQAKDDPLEFVHKQVGFNYRMTNITAAMGCGQIELLDDFIASKRRTACVYSEALGQIPGLVPPSEAPDVFSTFWLYTVLLDPEACAIDSRGLMRELAASRIQTRPLWQAMHMSPAHDGAWSTDCSVSTSLTRNALSLPCSVGVTQEQRETVIREVRRIANARTMS